MPPDPGVIELKGMTSHSFYIIERRSRLRVAVITIAGLAFCLGVTSGSAVRAQESRTIGKIDFVGLKNLSVNEVIASSGLSVGQPFDLNVLDEATQKLADSGLFKNIGYRTTTSGNSVTIIFLVEESKAGSSSVVFDNFVWFTDTELIGAVRREVSAFNGTAPNAGAMTDSITAALQKLLNEHKIKGTVEYLPSQDDLGSAAMLHVFTVSGNVMRICNISYPGANNISESKLLKASTGLVSTEYSRKFSTVFALKNLGPMYREVGQLRATFKQPLAKISADSKCKGGVDLTIPIDEGSIYIWERADWSDNNILDVAELNKELGMKSGEVANGLKIDKGLAAIKKAYGRRGYMERRLTPQPEFDELAARVTYRIAVNEGPQYKMGTLSFKGFSEGEEKRLREKWDLEPGTPFNEEYYDDFTKHALFAVLGQKVVEARISTTLRPNKTTHRVDVSVQIIK